MGGEKSDLWKIFLADELRKMLISLRLSGREWEFFWVAEGETLRLNKPKARIPARVFRQDMGPLSKSQLGSLRRKLIYRNMITVYSQGPGFALSYSIQKDISRWKPLPSGYTDKKTKLYTSRVPVKGKPRPSRDTLPYTSRVPVSRGAKIKKEKKERNKKETIPSDIQKIRTRIKILREELVRKYGDSIDEQLDEVRELKQLKEALKEMEESYKGEVKA